MTDKQLVLQTVRQLPEALSLAEISEEIALLTAIRRGENAADAGHVTPHEDVRKLMNAWAAAPADACLPHPSGG